MHNVVVANNSRFALESDSDSDSDDGSVQRACFSSSKPRQRACGPSNYDDDGSDSKPRQRSCGPSNDDDDVVQGACAPSNDIDNFCITDETPFSSENVNTILKSFAKN
jgi:hypothetical protein